MKLLSLPLFATLSAALVGCEIHLSYDEIPPEAPTLMSAEAVGRTTARLTLETSLRGSFGAESYEISVLDSPRGEAIASSQHERIVARDFQTFTVPGLRPGVPAYLSVVALDAASNESSPSVIGPVLTEFDYSGAILPPSHESGDNALGYQLVHADFNGDGLDDIAVSAPFRSVGNLAGAGAVYIYLGGQAGMPTIPSFEIVGDEASAQLGNSLATLDWNDDGTPDLAAGAPFGDNGNGKVIIFDGRSVTGGQAPITLAAITSDGVGWFAGAALGFTMATVEFDGDGHTDLAIGAVAGGNRGGVLVVFGGGKDAASEVVLSDSDANLGEVSVARLTSPSGGDLYGMTLANVGEISRARGSGLAIAGFQSGSVVVMRGADATAAGRVTDVEWNSTRDLEIVSDLPAVAYFGASVGSIDVDGERELVVGAYRADDGDGLVATIGLSGYGVIDLSTAVTATIRGEAGAQFGSAIANNTTAAGNHIGDIDGDGREDLVIVGGSGEVELHVWYGGQLPVGDTDAASADHRLYAPTGMQGEAPSIGGTPASAVFVGDVDGDGLGDLAWADWTGNGRDGLFEVLR